MTIALDAAIEDWMAGVNSPDVWIGLNDGNSEGNFVWVEDTGTTIWAGGRPPPTDVGAPVDSAYTNWEGTEPNDGNGANDCVIYDSSGAQNGWLDRSCTATHDYICQIAPPDASERSVIGAEVYVGSCGSTTSLADIKQNHGCHVGSANSNDLPGYPTWVGRECGPNHYGRYVYVVKEASDAWLSLCEVEVWGREIPYADRPKVGFTLQTRSDLEENLANASPLTVTLKRTDGNPGLQSCCDIMVSRTTSFANAAAFVEPQAAFDETEDFASDINTNTMTFSFLPTSSPTTTNEFDFEVVVYDDDCPAPDEQFGFEITTDGICLLAGDPDAITYSDITFTIQNDDVTYCWKDITLSDKENEGINPGIITAVLTRSGYTGGTTTAYVKTLGMGDAAGLTAVGNVDFTTIVDPGVDPLSPGVIQFGPGDEEKPIELTILEDNDCETTAAMDEMFLLQLLATSEGKICKDANTDADITDVTVTIVHDDVKFAFQQAIYEVSETDKTVEVTVWLPDGPVDRDVSVDVESQPLNPTASADPEVDYMSSAIDTTLQFASGTTTASITLPVIDDMKVEEDEEIFQLILVRNPTSLPECVVDGGIAQVKILDDDCNVSLDPPQLTLREGVDTTGDITIKCEREAGSTATVAFPMTANLTIGTTGIVGDPKASSGDDFNVIRTQVAITGPSTVINPFRIIDDILEEPPEYFEVSLDSVADGQVVAPKTTVIEILDDDVTVQIKSCGENGIIRENGKHITVTLERTGDLTSSDSVRILTKPDTAQPDLGTGSGDYVHINTEETFTAMQSTIFVNITINDDIFPESDEEFIVQIERHNTQTNVDSTLDFCRVTIIDDDCKFDLSVPGGNSLISVSEGDGEVEITVTRTENFDRAVKVG
ncbi:uncharacterized protein [Amphiura filiformis]|uniref:uncharacterized protein n=1 Tax=Amphiura filiformis TaxID=82378 RepID=UPI003B227220